MSVVHNTLLACPIQAAVISWSFKMPESDFYLHRISFFRMFRNILECSGIFWNVLEKRPFRMAMSSAVVFQLFSKPVNLPQIFKP